MPKQVERPTCPNCGTKQGWVTVIDKMGLGYLMQPRKWRCKRCDAQLAFTNGTINAFWFIGFSSYFAIPAIIMFTQGDDVVWFVPFLFLIIFGSIPAAVWITTQIHGFEIDVIDSPRHLNIPQSDNRNGDSN
ncbi:MAG: transposase [bacterium]|nr:transposase [bacterium]